MPSASCSAGMVPAISSSQSVPTPAATSVGARSQALGTPWSSSQSLSASSASPTSIGDSSSALTIRSTAASCSSVSATRALGSTSEVARWASLPRILLTRSRSAAVARTAAAAGLLSSWVSPADSRPSDSSRSRWPMIAWLERIADASRPRACAWPSGTTAGSASPNTFASITQNSASVTRGGECRGSGGASALRHERLGGAGVDPALRRSGWSPPRCPRRRAAASSCPTAARRSRSPSSPSV